MKQRVGCVLDKDEEIGSVGGLARRLQDDAAVSLCQLSRCQRSLTERRSQDGRKVVSATKDDEAENQAGS